MAVALSDDPASLGELLVHEMQHVKLAALADQFDLFDRADGRLFPVPWRRDPRPIYGLLHGTYAHLAVAELWRARPGDAGPADGGPLPDVPVLGRGRDRRDAGRRLSMPAGERFVEGMRGTVNGWPDDW